MRNYTVFSIWEIPIRINVSLLVFLPILAYLIGSGTQIELYAGYVHWLTGVGFDLSVLQAGTTPWVIGAAAAVGLFASVTVHELGHSWVALRYGIGIESITLWILGGIASLESIPREWDREFWIAVAGPLTSLGVAAVCAVGVLLTPASLPVVGFVLGWLAVANIVLAAFNMLPAFPMDGGRVFRALLARTRPYGRATQLAGRVGVIFGILFAVVGALTFQLVLLLLAFFIYSAAKTESNTVMLDELLDGYTVGDVMTREPATVAVDDTVATFGERMLRDRQTIYPVIDGSTVVGVVTLGDVQGVAPNERSGTRLDAVMREVPRLAPGADAFDTLLALQEARSDVALVEIDGRFVGTVSESDYAQALAFRRNFPVAAAQ